MNPYRRALEGWTEEQWIKGVSRDLQGTRFCAIGRLKWYGYDRCTWESLDEAARPLDALALEMFPDRASGFHPNERVIAWVNDHPDTTFEDVTALFEKAAVRWDEQT